MPNWVDNTLIVTGDEADVKEFVERAAQPVTQFGEERQSDLSFWNFVRPDDSILNEYWGEEPRLSLAEALQHKTNHWYDWNVRNWGCKWDAKEVDMPDRSDGYAHYTFDTPWGAPEEFFKSIVQQYPDLDFNLRFLEEQGWGGELGGSGGQAWLIKDWGIPDTHEERMEHIGYCNCDEMRDDEMEWMYDDCPRKVEATAKQVQQTV
jgi:hypothetical protein